MVNNTSLETGRRLQVPDPLELNRSFQRLAAERGLSHLSSEPLARPTARARRSRGERAAEARGERSWVADIRARADVARALAASPAEYRSLLAAMGVELADAARRGPRRDWVYSLADSPSRRIRGERLGLDYGRASVCAAVIDGAPPIDRGAAIRAAREAVAVDGRAELDRLANAASTIWRRRARSLAALDGMAAAAERAWRRGKAEALRRAREFASEKSLLPQRSERPRRSLARGGGEAGAPRRKTTRDRGPERTRDERRGQR